MPSNSLAAVYGLAMDCAARRVLGADTMITVDAYDETNTRIWPARIARDIAQAGGGLVGLVGRQKTKHGLLFTRIVVDLIHLKPVHVQIHPHRPWHVACC